MKRIKDTTAIKFWIALLLISAVIGEANRENWFWATVYIIIDCINAYAIWYLYKNKKP